MRKTPSCQKNVATVLKHDGNYSYAYYSLTVTTAQNKSSYQPKCHPLQGSQLHGATRRAKTHPKNESQAQDQRHLDALSRVEHG